ncbi:MAG: GNAT family N-acetyltransferase [Bacteroidota bacterium]|nr:GNAT family N-acetyltransferase [Bacteroidota bacterium]
MLNIQKINKKSVELDIIKELFVEYLYELNEDLCFQSFDSELENPLKKYGEPNGFLLLGYWNDEPAGCIGLQQLPQQGICEMKRLFVRPRFRHFGVGAELISALLKEAATMGYKKMVLDTLERLQPAIQLYKKHGFVNTSPYYTNPLDNVMYMEKML